MPHAERSVLRFPEHHGHSMELEAVSRCTAGTGWSGSAFRDGVRGVWGRLSAIQRGQFAGESAAGAGPDRSVDEEECIDLDQLRSVIRILSEHFDGYKEKCAEFFYSESQPTACCRLRLSKEHQRVASVVVGGAAFEKIAQLLDYHREARRFSAHHGGLGTVAGWPLPVLDGKQVAQDAEPGGKSEVHCLYGECG